MSLIALLAIPTATPTQRLSVGSSPAGVDTPADLPEVGVDVTISIPPVTVPTTIKLPKVTLPITVPTLPPITLPKPAATDVFYVQPFGQHTTLVALDWSGTVRRTLHLDKDAECCGMASSSPNGAHFVLGFSMYAADGTPGAEVPYDRWADDNAHLCRMDPQHYGDPVQGPHSLKLKSLDGSFRVIADLPALADNIPPYMAACSVVHNRVVLFDHNPPNRATRIVRITDGHVSNGPAACAHGYAVSPNGKFIVGDDGDGTATICDLDTGLKVGELPFLGALTGGTSAYAIGADMDHCGWYHDEFVYDWRLGQKVWSSNASDFQLDCEHAYTPWRYNVTGNEVAFQAVHVNAGRDPGDVIIVNPGHPARLAATNITYSQLF